MKEIIIITIAIVIGLAVLTIDGEEVSDTEAIVLASEEIFEVTTKTLHKGKEISWDWKTEIDQLETPSELLFWIEDSQGNKYNEIEHTQNKSSFTIPYNDTWTLKWENPFPAQDDLDRTDIKLSYTIYIRNDPPTASIQTARTSGFAPLTITFNGTAIDTDGSIDYYQWDFGNGNSSSLQNATYTFHQSGTYIVTLTVVDEEKAIGTDSIEISVYPSTS